MKDTDMSFPCEQKDNISKLYDLQNKNAEKLHIVENRQIEIAGDVRHIKGRIDNGMSHTIARMSEILARLEPIIEKHEAAVASLDAHHVVAQSEHHAKVVGKIEDIGWWVSKLVIAALLIVLVWAIANGANIAQVI